MAELTEEAGEVVVDLGRSLSGRNLAFAVGGVVVGALLGYWWTRRNLEEKYAEIADEEILAMQEHYRKKGLAGQEKGQLDEIVEERGYSHNSEGPGEPNTVMLPPEVMDEPVAAEEDKDPFEGWDWATELAGRSNEKPYIIHQDECNERDYTTSCFTYYEGDDVLADERSEPISNREMIVGEENLEKFGHGSGNPDIVFIRNDHLAIEVEICRAEGTYAEDIHGLKHADYPRERRKKFDDE
jgi:hypothetical protein